MRIQFKQEGGLAYLPGLSKPVIIESDKLPQQEANELQHLISTANFFNLPATVGASPKGADYRQYIITVEEAGRRHTVHLVDPVTTPELQTLLRFLQAKAKALRRATGTASADPNQSKN